MRKGSEPVRTMPAAGTLGGQRQLALSRMILSSPVGAAPRWRNRQTRRSQKPMSARTCEFDSRSRHHSGWGDPRLRSHVAKGQASAEPACTVGGAPGTAERVGTKRGHIDLSVDLEERRGYWFGPTLAGLGLVLVATLIYQLIVGGVKIEVTHGRLTIDPTGLFYWWHIVTSR